MQDVNEKLSQAIAQAMEPNGQEPPSLTPFDLVLHFDGHWTHEGHPITNKKIRALFDRSVRFLPEEEKYVVQVGRFRGEIQCEEAAFFVRCFHPEEGSVTLSDGSSEVLDPETLQLSAHDGAFLCRVKFDLSPEGHCARFQHAAQSELLNAVEEVEGEPMLSMGGKRHPLPSLA
jgi:hypothetical protein